MPATNPPNSQQAAQTAQIHYRFIIIPIGLIITLFIAVLRLFSPQQQKAPAVDTSAMNSGILYYIDGDYDMAMVMFNQVLFQQPESGEAYNNLGLVYQAKGDFSSALGNFEKAIQFMPNAAAPYCNRANVFSAMGDLPRAMADLDQAINLDAEFSKAYYNRALVEMALEKPAAAVADLSKAIEFSPLEQPLAQKIQQLSATLSDPFGIMEQSALTASYADPVDLYSNRAKAYFQSADPQSAAADLDTAIRFGLDPIEAEQIKSLFGSTARAFQPGHWQGRSINGAWQGPVSFDLDSDGVIHNFKLEISVAFDTPCLLTADGIILDDDLWFSHYFDSFFTKSSIPVQGVLESATSASGTVSPLEIDCHAYPNQWIKVTLPAGITWSAQWQGE